MNYKSNLEAPDLRPYFKHLHERVTPQSMGHLALSDFADKPANDPVFAVHKNCQFWTLDEAAILYNCAGQIGGNWLDIGAHTGWTASYLSAAGCSLVCVDPMFENDEFEDRFSANMTPMNIQRLICRYPGTSNELFRINSGIGIFPSIYGAVIDGNHDSPFPLDDAKNSAKILKDRGLIMLHDFWGWPIQDAVAWLQQNGFNVKIYNTPNGVACCWRGEFTPPEHVPDPSIDWSAVWKSRVTKFVA